MRIVNIHEAKTHLTRLIERAAAGEPFVIAHCARLRMLSATTIRSRSPTPIVPHATMHRLVATKLRANPAILDEARDNLRRWQKQDGGWKPRAKP